MFKGPGFDEARESLMLWDGYRVSSRCSPIRTVIRLGRELPNLVTDLDKFDVTTGPNKYVPHTDGPEIVEIHDQYSTLDVDLVECEPPGADLAQLIIVHGLGRQAGIPVSIQDAGHHR